MFKYVMIATVLLLLALPLTACSGTATSVHMSPAPTAAAGDSKTPDTDGDGIPDSAEAVLGTDPQTADTDGDGQTDLADANPLALDNPIQEDSSTVGFSVTAIAVENNVDSAGVAVPDHLELTVSNAGESDITGFDIHYVITDTTTGAVQSFYQSMPDLTLKAGETTHLHFDTTGAAGHFRADPNSLFYMGQNALNVEATLHASGYAPQTVSVGKDAPGNEAGGD